MHSHWTLLNMYFMLVGEMARYTLLHLLVRSPLLASMGLILLVHCLTTGPVSNVLVVSRSPHLQSSVRTQDSISRRHASSLPTPLDKYENSSNENVDLKPVTELQAPYSGTSDAFYCNHHVMKNQIEKLSARGFICCFCFRIGETKGRAQQIS